VIDQLITTKALYSFPGFVSNSLFHLFQYKVLKRRRILKMAAEVLGLKDLETSTGEKVDAGLALKGKIVGLFFTASWCPP